MKDERAREPTARVEPLDYILAHDLNNYLNIIQGHADLLLADLDDPDIVDRLTTIKRQTIAANALLQTVAGVTRGGAQGQYDLIDVGNLLSMEIERLQSAYPVANISTEIDEDVRARADELLLSVFANLIENALKHNDSSTPTVHLTASTQDGSAVISVRDDGPGLPDDVRDQLLGRGLAHPQSGVHIIRTLVERYGGDISVETGQEGTTVTVELPGPEE